MNEVDISSMINASERGMTMLVVASAIFCHCENQLCYAY